MPSRIIRRGTLLIAAAPTGWSRPGFVTRPTPGPPSMEMPGRACRSTVAKINAPVVASGSSPPSFSMAQVTALPQASISRTGKTKRTPFGVDSSTRSRWRPVRSMYAAAFAAAAAQEPVV